MTASRRDTSSTARSEDTATPHEWSQACAAQLEGGHLLTRVGEGRGPCLRGGRCVDESVTAHFLEGVPPAEEWTC